MNIQDFDTYLHTAFSFSQFAGVDTINGIQVMHDMASIHKIALAVDSSLPVMEAAAEQGANVLMAHHGMYWGQEKPITGTYYKKIQCLLQTNMALYAIHLPLDAHMQWGNNAQIAKLLRLDTTEPFDGLYRGVSIGVQGTYATPQHRDTVVGYVFPYGVSTGASIAPSQAWYADHYGIASVPVEDETIHSQPPTPLGTGLHGADTIKRVAIISGGGTKGIEAASHAGVDLYITGDASHTAWLQAEELGINVVFMGHYYSEVWGILALGAHLKEIFSVEVVFIDAPTGH